jgi:hypothetical protein
MPKAFISTYLAFFPVAIGMVKGLRSPEAMHLDLMHTYNATQRQTFLEAALPASLPYLFASMKIASPSRSSARLSASCRPARRAASARGCSTPPITARPSRSGRRCLLPLSCRACWSTPSAGSVPSSAAHGRCEAADDGGLTEPPFMGGACLLDRGVAGHRARGHGAAGGQWWRLAGLNLAGRPRLVNLLIPVLFGATLLVLWEGITRGWMCRRW